MEDLPTPLGPATAVVFGIFRKDNIKPLVGDDVRIEITDPKDCEGNIIEILPRRSALIRPAVANIDQALLIFAVAKPDCQNNLCVSAHITVRRLYHQITAVCCRLASDT